MPEFDFTKKEIRYRLKDPKKFSKVSFRRKKISKGISLVVACPKSKYSSKVKRCKVGMKGQAVRFDRDYFTLKQAKRWVARHRESLR